MKHSVAEAIGLKARALKHCDKLISRIDKNGRADIKVCGTGVVLPCEKNDAVYTLLQSIRFRLIHEINSIEIVSGVKPATPRSLPAPTGACEEASTMPEVQCVVCGKKFVKHHHRQKYCCEDCAKEAQKSRK